MPTKQKLKELLQTKLPDIIVKMNAVLCGKDVHAIETVIARIGRDQRLPHWFEELKTNRILPNLKDGKTIGSVLEMLLVGVLETYTFAGLDVPPLRVQPARGVDIPDLDLGVKTPSKNYDTSEPFFSAYERLLGSEHDILVLLTDFQESKHRSPFRLQIIGQSYLRSSQIADHNLCRIALKHRKWLVETDESRAKRAFRFLAYVNQSDWRAKRILFLIDNLRDEKAISAIITKAEREFAKTNRDRLKKDQLPIPESHLAALMAILAAKPLCMGIIDAADNWVVEIRKDTARAANDNEWSRLLSSPLDGKIGVSLALQWRYDFRKLFGVSKKKKENEET